MSGFIPRKLTTMATVLMTELGSNAVYEYLSAARKTHSQVELAKILEIDPRTLRRWEARQSVPPNYIIPALKQLMLPLNTSQSAHADFTFIDLFAGIGGIRTAFEGVGGRCVFTSEWDSYAQKTYAANFADGHPIAGDITGVNEDEVPDHDVMLAGFPCQPFSIAGVSKKNALGRAHGFADETQGTLFFDVARIIKAKRPRAFLLENVKNLQSHDKGRTFDVIKRTLTEELGYHIHWKVIDAAHFVPQHRERIIIVGFREPVGFDWAALQLPAKGERKLAEIFHKTDGTEPVLPWDEDRYFDHKVKKVLHKFTLSDHLWTYLQGYAEKHRQKGNGFGFGLVTGKDISRTLSARYYKDGSEILIKQLRKSPRRLTPRECARLMGLPDTFKIPVSDTRAYQMLSIASVPPMIVVAARLLVPLIQKKEAAIEAKTAKVPNNMSSTGRWTKKQLKLAFHLYCQLPFGKMHSGSPEIVSLASLIGRTSSAVAMKLVNFASLDPAITTTGRKGLGNASALDREIWDEFQADWESLATECAILNEQLCAENATPKTSPPEEPSEESFEGFAGETRKIIIAQRIKQHFFRRAVLSSYRGRCCMSGLSDTRLIVASHIVPWSKDRSNRLNPSNGLCLSALHDKAFDRGLIALTDDLQIMISSDLSNRNDSFVQQVLVPLQGKMIEVPEKFGPDKKFLQRHRQEIFLDR
jgi:DNA-cytosine methyltransferase